jgi:hypothetical protein
MIACRSIAEPRTESLLGAPFRRRVRGVRGVDGPSRSIVNVTVTLLRGQRSRVTIELDFDGHGIENLLVPLVVRREARKEMPANLRTLKERLEEQR